MQTTALELKYQITPEAIQKIFVETGYIKDEKQEFKINLQTPEDRNRFYTIVTEMRKDKVNEYYAQIYSWTMSLTLRNYVLFEVRDYNRFYYYPAMKAEIIQLDHLIESQQEARSLVEKMYSNFLQTSIELENKTIDWKKQRDNANIFVKIFRDVFGF